MNPEFKREAPGRYLSPGIHNSKNEASLELPGASTQHLTHSVGGRSKTDKNGILKIAFEPLDPGFISLVLSIL